MWYNQPTTEEEALEILARYEKGASQLQELLGKIRDLREDKYPLLSEAIKHDTVWGEGNADSSPIPPHFHYATAHKDHATDSNEIPVTTGMAQPMTPATHDVSWVEAALNQLRFILQDKWAQYAARGEFDNFLEQARVARVEPRQIFRGMIGQKMEREQVQTDNRKDRFDSVLDMAGYAVLFLAYELQRRNG